MKTIEIVFSIYGMIVITLVLVILKKIDADNKRMSKEVKHGHWFNEYGVHKCSCCNGNALVVCDQDLETFEYMSDFCPWCGAEMSFGNEREKETE